MISVRMETTNIPNFGPHVLTETFEDARYALAYLSGYIGAAPILIHSFEVEEC